MRLTARTTLAATFAIATFLVVSPSFATDTRDAIRACDKNPACSFDVGKDGVVISVGGSLVVCPIKNGPCGVARTAHHQVNFSAITNDLQYSE
jgi:hypothetical protein